MKSVKKNILSAITKEFIQTFFPVIVFAYVSRIFSTEGIGKINFSNTFVTYFVLIAGLGLNRYGTREGARLRNNPKAFGQLFAELTLINAVMTILSVSVYIVIINKVNALNSYKIILAIYGVAIPFSAMSMEWVYGAFEEYEYITKRILIFRCLGLISTFLFVHNKEDLVIFAVIQVVTNYGNNIINYFNIRKYININGIKTLKIKRHLVPMVTLFAASLSTTLYSNIDVTMLGFFTNDSVVGLYSTAIKFIHLMSGILIAGVSVLLPRVSLLMAEKNDEIVQRNQMIVSNCIYMITIPCICGMIVWGRWILAIFAGSDFQGAYVILCILSMTLFSTVTRSLYESMMLVPMRKDKIIMAATFSSALLNIILNYILIPRFSGIGAAVASVASEMTVISIYSLYSCVKKTYKVINHETLHYIIGGVLILTFWILLCMVLNESVSALIATLLGGGLYIAYCYIYKELYFRQFLTFFKFGKGNRK